MDELSLILEKAKKIHRDEYLSQDQKNIRLSTLMTIMEREYNIPMLNNPEWNKSNPEVIKVYRAISDMRSL